MVEKRSVRFATETKWAQRQRIIEVTRDHFGIERFLRGSHLWSLSDVQDATNDLCEINQFCSSGLITESQYVGFNDDDRVVVSNRLGGFEKARWPYGAIEERSELLSWWPPKLIFLDYCQGLVLLRTPALRQFLEDVTASGKRPLVAVNLARITCRELGWRSERKQAALHRALFATQLPDDWDQVDTPYDYWNNSVSKIQYRTYFLAREHVQTRVI